MRQQFLARLTPAERVWLAKYWPLWARPSQLQLDVERRFGQLRTLLIVMGFAVLVSIGPESHIGRLVLVLLTAD